MDGLNCAAPIITMRECRNGMAISRCWTGWTWMRAGEKLILCGPSGSGKSTTIRLLNRLEEHQRGRIVIDGIELDGELGNIERIRAEVGMVFQHFNLFPHLTVLENCTLAPMLVKGVAQRDAERHAMQYRSASAFRSMPPSIRASFPAARSSVAIARALHAAEDHAVRRADVGAGSRDGQGSAGHHGGVGARWHDHDLRDT